MKIDDSMVRLVDVWKIYKNGDEVTHSLSDLNHTFKRGSMSIIYGPSGSGKSTFVRVVGLLEKITMGQIFVNGIDTSSMSQEEKNSLIQEEIGFVFRNDNLIPTLNAFENVNLPLNSSDKNLTQELLEMVDFKDFNRYPKDMSKEEEIRVSIARAMVNDHSILITDEPTGDLHKSEADNIMKLLQDLNRSQNLTIILTTNNKKLSNYGDLLEIEDGNMRK